MPALKQMELKENYIYTHEDEINLGTATYGKVYRCFGGT
jgi:hypothetical protein